MSQENVELTYRAIDAFKRRDLDAYLALMDDDVEVVPRTGAMEGGSSYRGHDGVRRWWNNVFDVFPDWTIEVVEARDLGDLTFATTRVSGHGAGSTAPTDQAIWMMARLRRGRCVWWGSFDTRAEALEAVGLSEQDAHAESRPVAVGHVAGDQGLEPDHRAPRSRENLGKKGPRFMRPHDVE